ncbi:uncharacterized protein ARMOST_21813 [Armillaria ostoyae]|uniref:Uncharacterized protein n=1 Tax=Armillaria ostoyae TaxID=47428 RepID=A0A284SB70_ARMOS|nr:uncharacterized protein ARMOST_21813 [Armillaria ostoyae]
MRLVVSRSDQLIVPRFGRAASTEEHGSPTCTDLEIPNETLATRLPLPEHAWSRRWIQYTMIMSQGIWIGATLMSILHVDRGFYIARYDTRGTDKQSSSQANCVYELGGNIGGSSRHIFTTMPSRGEVQHIAAGGEQRLLTVASFLLPSSILGTDECGIEESQCSLAYTCSLTPYVANHM